MKSKTLILSTIFTLLVSVTQAGTSQQDSVFGTWSGKRHRRAEVTGGELSLFAGNVKTSAAVVGPVSDTPVTGSISVPNLTNGTFRVEQITGTLRSRGRIVARFPSGHLRGHLDQGLHDVAGRISVRTGLYTAHGTFTADNDLRKE